MRDQAGFWKARSVEITWDKTGSFGPWENLYFTPLNNSYHTNSTTSFWCQYGLFQVR